MPYKFDIDGGAVWHLSGEDSLVRCASSFPVTVHVNYTVCKKKLLQEFHLSEGSSSSLQFLTS